MIGICRLCDEEKRLIDAHLVPKCLYALEKGKPLSVMNLSGNARPTRSQSGIYDSGILCADCDGQIGRWDQHACEKLHADRIEMSLAKAADGLALDKNGEVTAYEIHGVDPKTLSLFVLSVLWRYHHSSRQEAAVVKLGPHASRIRTLLLNESSPNDHGYSVYLEYNPDFPIVVCLGRRKLDGGITVNSFCAQGLTYYLKTDSRPDGELFSPLRLLEGRPVIALNIRKLRTPLGEKLLSGIRKSEKLYGDPWKRQERK